MNRIDIEGVTVETGGRALLSGVTLAIAPGAFLAIAGPNGSGKSTLLRMAAGLWAPSRGRVLLDGADLRTLPRRHVARRLALVPQDTRLDFAFSVREVVAMGRYPHRGRFAAETPEDRRAIDAALHHADVEHLADRAAHQLSGGERQRVLIARCLAAEPGILLLDEPVASLDIDHTLEILDLCRRLAAQGRAVAMAIHDLNAAARYATDLALLNAGRLAGYGPAAQVLTPEALRGVFGVEAELLQGAGGAAMFHFRRVRESC